MNNLSLVVLTALHFQFTKYKFVGPKTFSWGLQIGAISAEVALIISLNTSARFSPKPHSSRW